MHLLIDIGNSRTKWSFVIADVPGISVSLDNSQWLSQLKQNSWKPGSEITTVSFACVANEELAEALVEYCIHAKVRLQRIATMSQWKQLINGYENPAQMGVDRWLAMIAAWDSCNKDCLIIDCGTAITVDAIDADGQHLGGHIVPGIETLKYSLNTTTASIKAKKKRHNKVRKLANNTTDAVYQGSLQMVLDYLENSWQRFQQSHPKAHLFICGGNGALFSELLNYTDCFNEDLVLKGIYLQSSSLTGNTDNV